MICYITGKIHKNKKKCLYPFTNNKRIPHIFSKVRKGYVYCNSDKTAKAITLNNIAICSEGNINKTGKHDFV